MSSTKGHLGRIFAATLAVALAFATLPARRALAGDRWYRDLAGHWARPYVRVLWEEGVTDGFIDDDGKAYFQPESNTSRAELATMLCKVFVLPPLYPARPSYPDVPPTYSLFPGKAGWPWIEGALAGGIAFVRPGEPFDPDGSISREDAVELLVRSLDLAGWAAALSDEEIEDALAPFRDHSRVSRDRRASMACAVLMGIIKGYEDHSIRPRAHIARGESATVVARSCLIRMSARLNKFSPDCDGVDDSVDFDVGYLKNRGITQWQASIEDASGKTMFLFNTEDSSGEPPRILSWDGSDLHGDIVPDGIYYYQAWVWDNAGRQFSSVRRPIAVETYWLQAYISPETFRDGERLTVTAYTQPEASSVTVTFSDSSARALQPSRGGTRWTLKLIAGSFIDRGPGTALVKATFGDLRRQVILSFIKIEDLWLMGSITPNPAAWSQTVQLRCNASPSVIDADATIFGDTVHLARSGGSWSAAVTVPWGLAPGFYPATFTGRTGHSEVQCVVSLEVKGPGAETLTYFLSR